MIDYLIVNIKATTDGDFQRGNQITHADIEFSIPCDTKKEKAFIKAKDNLLNAVKEIYSFEDQHQVDVRIEYLHYGVNEQWTM